MPRLRATLVAVAMGCAIPAPEIAFHSATSPSSEEGYCAWFGDRRGDVLYFGEAGFWWSFRHSGGDPRADRAVPGPVRLGRFDLVSRKLLEPLAIAPSGASGTWDVLAHPNGRVYFTTFFDPAGSVDPRSGRVVRFGPETIGLNELAPGPDASLLASRYGGPGERRGAVVRLDPDGTLLEEFPLAAPEGHRVAAKSLAWDPGRNEVWVNTDLLPEGPGPVGYDARVLDASGKEILRFESPELHFVRFLPDGTGYLAWLEGTRLWLEVLPPERSAPRADGRRILLDEHFPTGHDFLQDLTPLPGGGVLATRWSGRVHRVGDDEIRSYVLPRTDEHGLYYTAVLADGHLCATFCGGVTVVCRRVD
ncbi:MAG: hypothetical protein ABFS46_12320 [Myxococcota bacterium]